jgi:hypothetical membrane protein
MDYLTTHPILFRLVFIGLGLFTIALSYSYFRSGKVRAGPASKVIADRSNDPLMFWIYIALMLAAGLFMCVVGAYPALISN